jgi:hypothetical protein
MHHLQHFQVIKMQMENQPNIANLVLDSFIQKMHKYKRIQLQQVQLQMIHKNKIYKYMKTKSWDKSLKLSIK